MSPSARADTASASVHHGEPCPVAPCPVEPRTVTGLPATAPSWAAGCSRKPAPARPPGTWPVIGSGSPSPCRRASRRRHDRGAKTHRTVVAKFHVTQIGQGNDPQLLFRDRLVVAFRNQRLRQLVLDFLAKLFLDDLPRRLPRAITGDAGITRVVVRDRVPFLPDVFRRQFDPQLYQERRRC